jgi:hypothetical protein
MNITSLIPRIIKKKKNEKAYSKQINKYYREHLKEKQIV